MEIRQGYSYHIKDEFFDHVHTVEGKPVTVHNELNRILTEKVPKKPAKSMISQQDKALTTPQPHHL